MGHVGDSRAYLFRDGELSQLTNDHTFVQSLIDEGRITEEEARVHPHRNLILKALDGIHEAEPDLFDVELSAGDRLLLCSDGACGVLDDGRLADILVDAAAPTTPPSSWSAPASRPAAPTTSPASSPTSSTRRRRRRRDPRARCWSAPPPSCRGASAAARRAACSAATAPATPASSSRSPAEIPDDVPFAIPSDPIDPEAGALRAPAAAPLRAGSGGCSRRRRRRPGLDRPSPRPGPGASSSTTSASRTARSSIFRGVNADLPGVSTSRSPYETTDVELDRLSDFDAGKVREGIEAGNLDDARAPSRTLGRRSPTQRRTLLGGRRHDHGGRLSMAQTGALMGFVHRRRRGAELFLLVLALAVGDRRLRRRRPRRRGRGPGRHRRVRRLAGRR